MSLADAFHLSATVCPWVFALSGVLVAAGAAMTDRGDVAIRIRSVQAWIEQGGCFRLRRSS